DHLSRYRDPSTWMKASCCNNELAIGHVTAAKRGFIIDLYEIPISLPSLPSRNHMRSVTGNCSRGKGVFDGRRILSPQELSLHCSSLRSIHMLDIILVAAAVGFFALSVGYVVP